MHSCEQSHFIGFWICPTNVYGKYNWIRKRFNCFFANFFSNYKCINLSIKFNESIDIWQRVICMFSSVHCFNVTSERIPIALHISNCIISWQFTFCGHSRKVFFRFPLGLDKSHEIISAYYLSANFQRRTIKTKRRKFDSNIACVFCRNKFHSHRRFDLFQSLQFVAKNQISSNFDFFFPLFLHFGCVFVSCFFFSS